MKRKSQLLDEGNEALGLPNISSWSDSRGSSTYISDDEWTRKLSDELATSRPSSSASRDTVMSPRMPLHTSRESRIPVLPPATTSSIHNLPSLSPPPVPHMAYLQDLQNQISTRTLAYQSLQREHQNLLSVFTRSQAQITALDQKFDASNTEIRNLHDGRAKLESYIVNLESQIKEIQKIRDDVQTQSITKGAQYMHIMAMSAKLQEQGISDVKKWKAEREQWELEKKDLIMQIQILETEKLMPVSQTEENDRLRSGNRHPYQGVIAKEVDYYDVSTSHRILHQESELLREKCQKLQSALQALDRESIQFNEAFERLGGIGRRFQQHLHVIHEKKPSTQHRKDSADDKIKEGRAF